METYISVIINGECNHADTYPEMIDCGYPDPIRCDYVDNDVPAEVCQKCGAYRFEDEDSWNGITEMPMIRAINSGKLIHDIERMPF